MHCATTAKHDTSALGKAHILNEIIEAVVRNGNGKGGKGGMGGDHIGQLAITVWDVSRGGGARATAGAASDGGHGNWNFNAGLGGPQSVACRRCRYRCQ